MSSEILCKDTLNELFEERFFAFGDDGLLCCNFFDKLINLSSAISNTNTMERD